MNILNRRYRPIFFNLMALVFAAGFVLSHANNAEALRRVNLLSSDGTALPAGTTFRWLVEEDKTYHVPLNSNGSVEMLGNAPAIDTNWEQGQTASVSFHHSYMPVVESGTQADLRQKLRHLHQGTTTSGKNYFISILPDSGYSIGGAPFKGSQRVVDVYVNANPIPTAQITIFAHEDIHPINNVWDQGEAGIEGFSIILEDAGGKYGASAGIQSADVYGNPLCTTYNADGSVAVLGSGCTTGPDGRVTIKNLAPGKYGIIIVPTDQSSYVQTSTIEGTKLIDAWVKANEPAFFGEFGPPGPHVSVGFVPINSVSGTHVSPALNGGSTISGNIVNLHLSRPPDSTFYTGGPFPHTTPWVGLNDMAGGELGEGLYAGRTAEGTGAFSIPNVPPGEYQLVIWDDNLDIVFGKNTVTIAADGSCNGIASCNLGDVGVFQWFTRLENYVFHDVNEDGIKGPGEGPIPEQNVNLRFRDGTIYQAFPTDGEGFVPFDQAFPFFSWLVAEVDFARFKATGSTVTVDDGGPVPFGAELSFGDQLNPQAQNNPLDPDANVYGDPWTRTEVGPVLTHAFQGFLGQTSVIEWGKTLYGAGENGGISGVVMYAVTRAEDNPELAAAEPWEPGIPGVTVQLYDSSGTVLLAETETDSWDASLPENCQYGANDSDGINGNETDDPFTFRGDPVDCFDGMRNWNQVRPGVFDGGYAFGPEFSINEDFGGVQPTWINVPDSANPDTGYMVPGIYVVKVIPPQGYEIIRSHDRNVDFGDEFYTPDPLALPPACVGPDYTVADNLSLFPGVPAPLAGQTLPDCDAKRVLLSGGGANAAADFFLFTEVPISGHIWGFILDDTANEFDPASPQFGEKYAPPFLPVSIRDWTGTEISRTVSDEFGVYNALVPSTYTENLAQPSGISPNMLTTCMNAKTKPDGSIDPLHNPQYSQFCYTFQYMPGSTTYLDTPVIPVAAFAGPDQNPLDCEFDTRTPRIESASVSNNNTINGGPYIPAVEQADGSVATGSHTMTIRSMPRIRVPNPAYDGVGGVESKTVRRDYRFGNAQGTVSLGGVPLTVTNWTQREIEVDVSGLTFSEVGGQQLTVTRANGNSTVTGLTVQVGLRTGSNIVEVSDGGSIQQAINDAGRNDLILVGPGSYNEMVIMWKPVQLQGWGEGSTFINAIKTPIEKLEAWRALAASLLGDGQTGAIDLIDGQELGFGGIEPDTFFSEEGAGVFVVAKDTGPNRFRIRRNRDARIDGFNISGADTGGGVVVNGFADYLEISNLKIVNNSAMFAGGIRVGHPFVRFEGQHTDAANNYVKIHHNTVNQNGGLDGAGGGIALHTGSDSYSVTDNFVCGNFTTASGAGIAHFGLSDRNNGRSSYPEISRNTVIFNENFNQGAPTNGGGILVAGKLPLVAGELSPGSGNVLISENLIQGNSSGAGDGGGIHLSRVNGQDIQIRGGVNNRRVEVDYLIDIRNNIIVNNVAGLAGGGISIFEALEVNIEHNTIAHNDNTSTSGGAFTPGIPDQSTPQPGAGIASRAHNADLSALIGSADSGYSDPLLSNNILWQNRVFYWLLEEDPADSTKVLTGLCPDVGGAVGLSCGDTSYPPGLNDFDDLAVLGAGNTADLTCVNCVVTDLSKDSAVVGGTQVNLDGDPAFVAGTFNGNRETTTFLPEVNTAIGAPPALDEGGNFIRLRYGPLTQTRDYHIQATSSALDEGDNRFINLDYDIEFRPAGAASDIGADELHF